MLRLAFLTLILAAAAASQTINSVVGNGYFFDGSGKAASQAPLGLTISIAIHPTTQEPHFVDSDNHMVMRVRADGTLFVVAGNGRPGFSGDGGAAVEASLNMPRQIAFDARGNLYITDMVNQRIRRVDPAGNITTVAGNGVRGRPPASAITTQAPLDYPHGIAVDSQGNLYIADHFNFQIRKVATDGRMTVFAGNGTQGYTGDGGKAVDASIGRPYDVVVDRQDNVYFVDPVAIRIRKVTQGGTITSVAGNGSLDVTGDGGPAVNAGLGSIGSLGLDQPGNLYIGSATAHTVRKVNATDGRISLYAGNLAAGFSGDGGPALRAQLFSPEGLGVDASGNLYIADRLNRRIRKVTPGGIITTIAGTGFNRIFTEFGPARNANLLSPNAMTFDPQGNLIIADTGNARIRRVTADGRISTIAGNGTPGWSGDDGPALQARIYQPMGVAADKQGNIYFTQPGSGENLVRVITPDGRIRRFAGAGRIGGLVDNVPAAEATFSRPIAIAVEESGAVLVGDVNNHAIRRIGTDGRVRTVIGKGRPGFSPDGTRAADALINAPFCIVPDRLGNIYFCDADNLRIRKIDTSGIITTLVGNGQNSFSGDGGPALQAAVSQRTFPAFAPDGTIYFADVLNNRIRKVDPFGIITTIAGTGQEGFSGDGGPPRNAALFQPAAVLLEPSGRLLIADTFNDRIRAISSDSPSFQVDTSTVSVRILVSPSGDVTIPLQELAVNLQSSLEGVPYQTSLESLLPGTEEIVKEALNVTPATGVMPGRVRVQTKAINARLPIFATGTVPVARLTISAPNATPPTRVITINGIFSEAPPPELQIDAPTLQFSSVTGGTVQGSRLQVRNGGGGRLEFTVKTSTPWLSIATVTGTAFGDPVPVEFTVVPGTLSPGTYSGAIVVAGVNGQSREFNVTLAVSDRTSSILLSQTALSFVAVAGAPSPPAQRVSILNSGRGAMTWSAGVRTLSGGNWLTLGAASGSSTGGETPPELTLAVDTLGLSPGDYSGLVTVSSVNAANRQQLMTVALKVLPANSDPVPEVSPSGLVFISTAGSEPGSATLELKISSGGSVEFTSARATFDGANWFEHVPVTGTVSPTAPSRIRLYPALANLSPGIRRGTLTVVFNDRAKTVRTVSILSIVSPPDTGNKPGERSASSCGSDSLFAEITSLQKPQFATRIGEPIRVRAKILDGCGNPHIPEGGGTASASVTVLPTQAVVQMTHSGNGEWTADYVPPASLTGAISVRVVAAFTAGTRTQIGVSERVSGVVQSTPSTLPQVSSGAIVNGASFVAEPLISPGQLISIYGSRLASAPQAATVVPLSTELGGTEVLMGGQSLPLLYVSENQINAQVPFGVALNSEQQVIVRRSNDLATPERVVIATAQPGIFAKNATGQGQGVILAVRPGGAQTYAEPGAPARAGDTLVIYCSGLGSTNPPVPAGEAAPLDRLSTTLSPVKVFIGGVEASIAFAGLTPGSAGLYQVNAVIPAGVPTGPTVPVVLQVAGLLSPSVTMAIQ